MTAQELEYTDQDIKELFEWQEYTRIRINALLAQLRRTNEEIQILKTTPPNDWREEIIKTNLRQLAETRSSVIKRLRLIYNHFRVALAH